MLPACAHFGLGVVPYSPLARGVLTGKYDPDQPPPEDSRAGLKDILKFSSRNSTSSTKRNRDVENSQWMYSASDETT